MSDTPVSESTPMSEARDAANDSGGWNDRGRPTAASATALLALLAPLTERAGITRVANVTGLDTVGIPVVLVVRPNSRSLSVSQGKGVTLELAKISGILESLEQHQAEHVRAPLVLGSYADLVSVREVADVRRLPRTPKPWSDATRLLWIAAAARGSGKEVLVPYELVHLDLTEPLPEGSGYFLLGSNGLASGFGPEQALAHAVWELVERDAITLFYERSALEQSRRRVVLATIDDPTCAALLGQMHDADLGVAVWDLTSDVGVATFLCSIAERRFEPLRPVGVARGYGCHPDRAIALRRALTEAAQSRLTRIAGSRDDFQRADVAEVRSEDALKRQLAHVEQEAFATRAFGDVASRDFDSFTAALDWTAERLTVAGLGDILSVDLSPPDAPFFVVRALVPGLEGYCDVPSYVAGVRALALRNAEDA
jgi:YcaO-like protein with predicted kinase domain